MKNPGVMFFPPATHGLVSVESGDLMASEIVPVPCECWASANLTRRKMFARAYDILLKFRGRSRVQDRMVWIGTEEGRDCYALQTYRLCCKWFAPRNQPDDSDVHARAFAASSTCASLPVAPHVPVAHTFARQKVQGNQGEWLDVDYILIDFVGPSMITWLMTINHQWTGAWSEMLRKSFLSLMLLCHRSHLSNLSWHQELLSESLCYDVVKRSWFWDGAVILDEQTVHISCARACHRAARMLMRELQAYMYAKAHAHSVFVQWQEWPRIHLSETKGSNIDVAGIAINLGLDHPEPP